jgi:hypothetical protein
MEPKNNGGTTDYYEIPRPELAAIIALLHNWNGKDFATLASDIRELFPQTLNDIIEFKNMKPWQHEVMKATYAIDARAKKNGGSELRELNKILYYTNRRKQQLLKELPK